MKPRKLSDVGLPHQILREFRADGDIATVRSLKLWLYDYHLEPPKMSANDNTPSLKPTLVETRIDGQKAERLIAALTEDEKIKEDNSIEKKLPTYSADLHEERFERVKRSDKSAPLDNDIDAEAEMVRHIDALKMRDWLGSDADILDMAVEPNTTFDDVGRHIGASRHNPAAEGKQEIKDIAATFYKRAA
jgi:hypothetical protein